MGVVANGPYTDWVKWTFERSEEGPFVTIRDPPARQQQANSSLSTFIAQSAIRERDSKRRMTASHAPIRLSSLIAHRAC
jgi:hypothetical protein